ncbi:hypothetical protein JCM14076_22720 [Methylosoma difficile]
MLTLYQFPVSHFCEKVRWALAYKRLEYRTVNLLPGLHVRTTKKLARLSSVPILVHDGKALQNSSDILTYLDEVFPQYPLLPEDGTLQQEALAWERFADKEIGPPVRHLCYHTLLDHPKVLIPFLTANGSWYGGLLMKAFYPKLSTMMRAKMRISPASTEAAQVKLTAAIDRIHARLQQQAFLVGGQFTRADLSAAALLAPLVLPRSYGLPASERMPEPLAGMVDGYREKIAWVDEVYRQYR